MFKWLKKSSHKTALAPGALIYVGDEPQDDVKISGLSYNHLD